RRRRPGTGVAIGRRYAWVLPVQCRSLRAHPGTHDPNQCAPATARRGPGGTERDEISFSSLSLRERVRVRIPGVCVTLKSPWRDCVGAGRSPSPLPSGATVSAQGAALPAGRGRKRWIMSERYITADPYPWPYNGDLRPANT